MTKQYRAQRNYHAFNLWGKIRQRTCEAPTVCCSPVKKQQKSTLRASETSYEFL